MNYKINQIKRIVESLNSYEIKELINYFMEKENININNMSIEEIAEKIENGELPETKELLMMKVDKTGWSVAHELAHNSYETNWVTNDKDILTLQNKLGWSVAHALAYYHPTWITSDLEILSLVNDDGNTVEDILRIKGKI